jgi:hypothetical protein
MVMKILVDAGGEREEERTGTGYLSMAGIE